jgi:PAS domain S-box-containing protein
MKWYTACKLKRVKEGLEKVAAVRSLKLKESERHFTNFLENLGDIAYTTDSHGNLTYTNKMAEIITGKPLKDIIGKPFFPLFAKKSHGCISKNLKRGKSPI